MSHAKNVWRNLPSIFLIYLIHPTREKKTYYAISRQYNATFRKDNATSMELHGHLWSTMYPLETNQYSLETEQTDGTCMAKRDKLHTHYHG